MTQAANNDPRPADRPAETMPVGMTFQDIYPKVLSLLPDQPGLRILDVGAGQGYFSWLARNRGHQVEACDIDPENFRCPDVPFRTADVSREIPAEDGSFDVVAAIEVLEHMENHTAFIREVVRVTKPGGLIILTTPNVLNLASRWNFFVYGFTDCAPFPLDPFSKEYYLQHINPISLPEIMFHLERHGAELVDLSTNRRKKGARFAAFFLKPFLARAVRAKFLRKKHAAKHELFERHIRWLLHPDNLSGRITIAVARRLETPEG